MTNFPKLLFLIQRRVHHSVTKH